MFIYKLWIDEKQKRSDIIELYDDTQLAIKIKHDFNWKQYTTVMFNDCVLIIPLTNVSTPAVLSHDYPTYDYYKYWWPLNYIDKKITPGLSVIKLLPMLHYVECILSKQYVPITKLPKTWQEYFMDAIS